MRGIAYKEGSRLKQMKMHRIRNISGRVLIFQLVLVMLLWTSACGREQASLSKTSFVTTANSTEISVPSTTPATSETSVSKTSAAEEKELFIHVAEDGDDLSGDGTEERPFASIAHAAEAYPGSVVLVHGGEYGPVSLGSGCSGTGTSPTVIRVMEGEKAVISADKGRCISLLNVSHILIEGLETKGGERGIEYLSKRDAATDSLEDICISNCTVRSVRGEHGICVYAADDLHPVRDLTIKGCEVSDCRCGSSESLVINGNVEGFVIENNIIHDNNNIGIDMIGFEGTAKHPGSMKGINPYDSDFVRNGICRGNVVYNISTKGNKAYREGSGYDLCAGGIYVDGGQDIEICENFIFNCDIGLEAATEHSPSDNDLFNVSGINVHDNVIADCKGWAGLCFGGYDARLGLTRGCVFEHNTLVDNGTQIAVQKSKDNRINANLILGGQTAVEFTEAYSGKNNGNDISGNIFAGISDKGSWKKAFGPCFDKKTDAADGFRPLKDAGSRFIPGEKLMDIYRTVKQQ